MNLAHPFMVPIIVFCLLTVISCDRDCDDESAGKKDGGNEWVKTISCYNCLSEACLNDICDPGCEVPIRQCHEVDSLIFVGMIKSFFNGSIPKPKSFPASHIDSILNLSNCQNPDVLYVCGDHDNNTDNDHITIGIASDHSGHCTSKKDLEEMYNEKQIKGLAAYSRAFFSSLMETEPDSFRFYKAIGISRRQSSGCIGVSKNDIVFEVLKTNTGGGFTTKYYDLSDLFP